ncbi:PAS domain S-box protein [Thermodesulfobacteriota bacterium]
MSDKPTYEELEQRIKQLEKAESGRKQAEKALRKSEETLEAILATAPVGIGFAQDRIVKWGNKALYSMLGYEEGSLEGKNVRVVYSDDEEYERVGRELYSNGQVESKWVGKDGRVFDCHVQVNPLNPPDISKGIIIAAVDITDRKRAEEALRESEEKHRTLLENIPQKIFFKDTDSIYVSCNKNYAKDLKINSEEITGKTDYEFYPKELAEKYREDDKKIIQLGETEEIEEKYIQNGQNVVVQTVKTPVRDEIGNVTGILGIFWDITDRKRVEEALRESELMYKLVVEGSNVGTWDRDVQTGNVIRNERAAQIYGYTLADMEANYDWWESKIHPDDKPKVIEKRQRHMNGETDLFEAEYRLQNRFGEWVWTMSRGKVVERDENGKPLRISGILLDITERKQTEDILQKVNEELEKRVEVRTETLKKTNKKLQAEITERKRADKALKESENRYRLLVETMSDGLGIQDENGLIIYVNNKFCKMLDYKADEFIGRPVADFVDGKNKQILKDQIKNRKIGMIEPYELEWNKRDGSQLPTIVSPQAFYDVKGKFKGSFAVITDTSDLKSAEKKIKASLAEKEILLSEVHHRVKNNFEIVSSLLDMSSMKTKNQEAQNLLKDARSRIHSMALIHSQLYENDRFDNIDMERHVHELANHLSQVYLGNGGWITTIIKPSEVYLSVNQAIPCALVLNELIANAFKHAFKEREEGKVRISINNLSGDTVQMSVKDDGSGISEDVDLSNATGLGLKLVRYLVVGQLKGEMRFHINNGTEFQIDFKKVE